MITNDAVILGILMTILALVFQGEAHPRTQGFFKIVPGILICYFLPGLLNTFGIINGNSSKLYFVASRYLLPASLVLLCINVDFPTLRRLGNKALVMFFAGTLGVMLGGPVALWIVGSLMPTAVAQGSGSHEVWRGLSTIAGSWIGGGANQTALKEVFQPSDSLFSMMIAVDVLVANIWMAILLYGAGVTRRIDAWLGADARVIDDIKQRLADYQSASARIPTLTDLLSILAVGMGCVAIAHAGADVIAPWLDRAYPSLRQFSLTEGFFWIVMIATTLGLALSFTPARQLEGAGASRIGSVFLYILVASIGMKMDLGAVFSNPALFAIGGLWMLMHAGLIIVVAKAIRAPFFLAAVGSQANVGGAGSAPVVASAFHPALAPVGVLLAVLGYVVGTYGGYLCGLMMQWVSGLLG